MRLYLSAVFENSSLMKTSKDITDIIDISKVHILQSFVYAKEEHAERYKDCKSFWVSRAAEASGNGPKYLARLSFFV